MFGNKFFERVEHLKRLGTTNQNSIHEEVKSRLTSENVCCAESDVFQKEYVF
jgi:hypothetical protein